MLAAAPAIVQPGGTRAATPGADLRIVLDWFSELALTRSTELIALPNFVHIDTLDDPRVADYRHIADPIGVERPRRCSWPKAGWWCAG